MRLTLEIDFTDRTLAAIRSLCGGSASPDLGAMAAILKELKTMSQQLTDLQAAVAAEDTVIASAVTLIEGLAAQLAAAGTDPVALQALTDDINAKAQELAGAVAANTPATPAT